MKSSQTTNGDKRGGMNAHATSPLQVRIIVHCTGPGMTLQTERFALGYQYGALTIDGRNIPGPASRIANGEAWQRVIRLPMRSC
jgi:hypothetical protein